MLGPVTATRHGAEQTARWKQSASTDTYVERPMDLADATLVALAEQRGQKQIFTPDSDVQLYRPTAAPASRPSRVDRLVCAIRRLLSASRSKVTPHAGAPVATPRTDLSQVRSDNEVDSSVTY